MNKNRLSLVTAGNIDFGINNTGTGLSNYSGSPKGQKKNSSYLKGNNDPVKRQAKETLE